MACATHMDGILAPKFPKQGSLFRQIFHKHGWAGLSTNWQKIAKNGSFSAFAIKVGMIASVGN